MPSINNDQNINRVYTKMSEDFHDENTAKLSKSLKSVTYFEEETTGGELSEEEINVIDHLYVSENENVSANETRLSNTNCQTAESEVKFIKEWLILHTDLIQQQNDDILDKDREIYILRKENEMLKERINCIEKGIPFQIGRYCKHKVSENQEVTLEDMTQGSCQEDTKENIEIVNEELCDNKECSLEILNYEENHVDLDESQRGRASFEDENTCSIDNSEVDVKRDDLLNNISDSYKSESDVLNCSKSIENYNFSIIPGNCEPMKNLRMSIRRKRVCSNSSALSNNESTNIEEKETYRHLKKKKRRPTKDLQIHTYPEPYVTQAHEVDLGIIQLDSEIPDSTTTLEVPRWRHKIYASCYTMEGTENLDDEVYNKRHMRLENDERRRKRWDVQRIREQRVIEKLKQRQERVGSGSKGEESEPVQSLWPKTEDVKFLEICDDLPVSAFGNPIPKLNPSEFILPWLGNPTHVTKKPHARRSRVKRKSAKR